MRKNLLSDLVDAGPELTAVNSTPPSRGARAAPLGSMGAVGAMSKALAQIASDREPEGRATADVIEIDTGLLVDSAIRDRLADPGTAHESLVASIKEAGQQVPILVRPVPSEQGKYQIAYGHRRVAALRELGLPVRALVRHLTDDEMVVAQGAENGDRKDLSFIERAHFALALETKGFKRPTMVKALNVDKTELSRLVSVVRAIPLDLIEAIGPAPKVGRRRWMDFAERIKQDGALEGVRRVMGSERFKASTDSDARFLKLFSAAAPKRPPASTTAVWTDQAGRSVARVARTAGRFILSIDETIEPAFGNYLLDRLPDLLASFKRREGV